MDKDKRRVTLCFADTPLGRYAYDILSEKGRHKAEYISRCIEAYEKGQASATPSAASPLPSCSAPVPDIEQMVRAAVSAVLSNAGAAACQGSPPKTDASSAPAAANADEAAPSEYGETAYTEYTEPDIMPGEFAEQALSGLDAFG